MQKESFSLTHHPKRTFRALKGRLFEKRQLLGSWIAADLLPHLPCFVLTALDSTANASLSQLTSFRAKTSVNGQNEGHKNSLASSWWTNGTCAMSATNFHFGNENKTKPKNFQHHGLRLLIIAYYIYHISLNMLFVSQYSIGFCLLSCVDEVYLWCLV